MKNFVVALLFLFSVGAIAQEWQTDMNLALNLAQENNKKIVLVFQGSDWCGPCIKLDKQVWSTPAFKEYAKDNFVMLQADFPRKKKNKLSKEQSDKNAKLFEKYNKQGIFPLVVVLDSHKKVLKTAGFKKMTASEYIEYLNTY